MGFSPNTMNDSSDKETVLAANQAFYDAFSNKELASMNLLWWQGSTSLCVHPGGRGPMKLYKIGQPWQNEHFYCQ
jgi:hypothetical protein